MSYEEKYDVAYHAAIKWIGRTEITDDPRFTSDQLSAYADEIALSLCLYEGKRGVKVNGMELVHTTFGWHVVGV